MRRITVEDYKAGKVTREEVDQYLEESDARNKELLQIPEFVTAVKALRRLSDILVDSLIPCRDLLLKAKDATSNKGVRVCIALLDSKVEEMVDMLAIDEEIADIINIPGIDSVGGDPD